jgi:hypothetical protein
LKSVTASSIGCHHTREITRRGRRRSDALDDAFGAGDKVLNLLEMRVLGVDGGDLQEQMLKTLNPGSNDLGNV